MVGSRNPLIRFEILVWLGKKIFPLYRFSWFQMDWWENKSFNHYLDDFEEQNGFNMERRWMLYQLLRLTYAIKGDTAECGVYKGASSYLICLMNEKYDDLNIEKEHFMFDSFEGLSRPLTLDGRHWSEGDLSYELSSLKDAMSSFKNVHYLKGWIPERFDDVQDRAFSFVHIDVDLFQPTFDSVSFFYPRLSQGAVLLCDDYGCTTCPGATKAIDDYLKDKSEKMISLPDGGGFLIKGVHTSPDFII